MLIATAILRIDRVSDTECILKQHSFRSFVFADYIALCHQRKTLLGDCVMLPKNRGDASSNCERGVRLARAFSRKPWPKAKLSAKR